MDSIISIWTFFQQNILIKPAFFIGFIVLIGYILLKKPLHEAFAGCINAIIGYMILNVGAGGLVQTFRPILAGLNQRFQLNAAVIDPYFGQAAAQAAVESIGRSFTMMIEVLLLSFMWNLILVIGRKITKIRTVFITGHIMVQQSSTALWLVLFCFPQLQNTGVVIMLGLMLGTYWAVGSNMTVAPCQELTGGGGFAVGHQQMFGIWAVDKLSEKIGKRKKKKIEDIHLPGFLSIFNESIVSTSLLMFLFFGSIMAVLGQDFMHELDKNCCPEQHFFFYCLEKALLFTVYIQILQMGVRLFIAELTESFHGISDKLLPGAMPAIDCAGIYAFGHQNTVTIGFLFGVLGQFIAIIGLIIFKSPIFIITGFVPVFFDNATIAVIANKKGGIKAACIMPFISGILQVLGGAFAAFYFGLGKFGGWHGNLDWDTVWPTFGIIMNMLQYKGVVLCIAFLLLIPQLQYYFGKYKKEHYFSLAENYESVAAAE